MNALGFTSFDSFDKVACLIRQRLNISDDRAITGVWRYAWVGKHCGSSLLIVTFRVATERCSHHVNYGPRQKYEICSCPECDYVARLSY